MKIIFLDIDGVLNNHQYAQTVHFLYGGNGYGGFARPPFKRHDIKWDPYNAAALKKLMNNSGANIVISSSWRFHHFINDFKSMFQLYGLKPGRIIDVTPDVKGGTIRGDDINAWLNQYNQVDTWKIDNYVILDDNSDFYPDQHLVQTDAMLGLTNLDVDKALKILNGKN